MSRFKPPEWVGFIPKGAYRDMVIEQLKQQCVPVFDPVSKEFRRQVNENPYPYERIHSPFETDGYAMQYNWRL